MAANDDAVAAYAEQLERLDLSIRTWRIGAFAIVAIGVVAFLLGMNSSLLAGAEAYMVSGTIAIVFGCALFPALAVAQAWRSRQLLDVCAPSADEELAA